jgi:hypothetical protein
MLRILARKEEQAKTTLSSFHLILLRTAAIKKTNNTSKPSPTEGKQKRQMLAKMWGKRNPHMLLVGMCTSAATMDPHREFLKKLKIELLNDLSIPLVSI